MTNEYLAMVWAPEEPPLAEDGSFAAYANGPSEEDDIYDELNEGFSNE